MKYTQSYVEQLETDVETLVDSLIYFCRKEDKGLTNSTETYKRFKATIESITGMEYKNEERE